MHGASKLWNCVSNDKVGFTDNYNVSIYKAYSPMYMNKNICKHRCTDLNVEVI